MFDISHGAAPRPTKGPRPGRPASAPARGREREPAGAGRAAVHAAHAAHATAQRTATRAKAQSLFGSWWKYGALESPGLTWQFQHVPADKSIVAPPSSASLPHLPHPGLASISLRNWLQPLYKSKKTCFEVIRAHLCLYTCTAGSSSLATSADRHHFDRGNPEISFLVHHHHHHHHHPPPHAQPSNVFVKHKARPNKQEKQKWR